ncbi:hypothetical protein HU200_054250 [Digitaria exilis]|uniref:Uncharacterized protein n=1 Tax=Digitaria exilis TaxID=1010633 RepID=A0A835AIX2_9POAL|nr:hypothetical protein HU200_054250 [Digitaria exilis]
MDDASDGFGIGRTSAPLLSIQYTTAKSSPFSAAATACALFSVRALALSLPLLRSVLVQLRWAVVDDRRRGGSSSSSSLSQMTDRGMSVAGLGLGFLGSMNGGLRGASGGVGRHGRGGGSEVARRGRRRPAGGRQSAGRANGGGERLLHLANGGVEGGFWVARPAAPEMSEYQNVVGGRLKLKGKALDVKEGGVKKKKKKKQHREESSQISQEELHEVDKVGEEEGNPHPDYDHLTPAERRYMEQKQKIDMQKMAKVANKSHRDRIQDFNQYLANLSEHYDIPKRHLAATGSRTPATWDTVDDGTRTINGDDLFSDASL